MLKHRIPIAIQFLFRLLGCRPKAFFVNNSGQVSFLSSPDFENPSDGNLDNSYEISIRAFDGSLYSASYNFTVNVINDESDDGDDDSSAICSQQSESTHIAL